MSERGRTALKIDQEEKKAFAKLVRQTRVELGLTQLEFAELLDVCTSTILHWENCRKIDQGPLRYITKTIEERSFKWDNLKNYLKTK